MQKEKLIKKLDIDINCELSVEELKLLYSIDYDIDYELFEYIDKRDNYYEDFCKIFGKEHVASTPSSITENTIAYIGDLSIYKKLPTYNLKYIYGDLDYRLDKVYNLENLKLIIQDADFKYLKSAEGLENLEYIGRDAIFPKLEKAEGLENLEYIGNGAFFNSLKSSVGLEKLHYRLTLDDIDNIDDDELFTSNKSNRIKITNVLSTMKDKLIKKMNKK